MIKSFLSTLLVLFFLCTSNAQIGVFQDFVVNASKEQAVAGSPDPVLNGLILSLSYEDNATLVDDLGVNSGTNNSTTLETGANGNALGYVAQTSWSEIPYDASLLPTDGLTIMTDYYPTAAGQSGTSNIVGLFNAVTGNHVYNLGHAPNNTVRGRITTTIDGTSNLNTTGTLTLNQWHRIMLRWTAGEGFRVSIDNSADDVSGVRTGVLGPTSLVFAVSMPNGYSGSTARMITGRVDNTMVWDRKLSDAEKTQMFTGNPTYAELNSAPADTTAPTVLTMTVEDAAPTDVVIGFDETVTGTNLGFTIAGTTSTSFTSISGSGSGTIIGVLGTAIANGESPTLAYSSTTGDIADLAGNDLATFTATAITNNVAVPVPTANLVAYWRLNDALYEEIGPLNMTATGETYAAGKFNNAFQYERNVSYSQVADNDIFSFEGTTSGVAPDDPFSVSLWAYFDSTADGNALLSKRSSGHEWQFQWLDGDLGLVLYSGGVTSNYDKADAVWTPTINTWYYLTATYSGTNGGDEVTLYVDGVDQGVLVRDEDVGTYVAMSNTTAPVYFGLYGPIPDNAFSMDGRMQNIAIWDKELTQAEVTAIYAEENADNYLTNGHTASNDLLSARAGARFSNTSTNVADWLVVANASPTVNTNATFIRSGTTSLKIDSGTLEDAENGSLVYDLDYLDIGTVAIGETARFSGWVYVTAVPTSDTMEVRLYHQTYALSSIFTIDQSKLNQWQYFELEHTRVSTSPLTLTLKSSTGTMYIDDMAILKY